MDAPADMKDPKTWLELAEDKLVHAHQIFEIGLYNDTVSRAYYAMFYATKAALLSKGVDLRRHSASIAKFRELFVITGQVEAEYLHFLGQAQSARERCDYVPFAPISRQGAEEILHAAERFIDRVKSLIEH